MASVLCGATGVNAAKVVDAGAGSAAAEATAPEATRNSRRETRFARISPNVGAG
jgi:hypothetical protein